MYPSSLPFRSLPEQTQLRSSRFTIDNLLSSPNGRTSTNSEYVPGAVIFNPEPVPPSFSAQACHLQRSPGRAPSYHCIPSTAPEGQHTALRDTDQLPHNPVARSALHFPAVPAAVVATTAESFPALAPVANLYGTATGGNAHALGSPSCPPPSWMLHGHPAAALGQCSSMTTHRPPSRAASYSTYTPGSLAPSAALAPNYFGIADRTACCHPMQSCQAAHTTARSAAVSGLPVTFHLQPNHSCSQAATFNPAVAAPMWLPGQVSGLQSNSFSSVAGAWPPAPGLPLIGGLRQVSGGSGSRVSCKLTNEALWKKFHRLTTEMVITKAGRRMFPVLEFKLSGLELHSMYALLIDIVPADGFHWKYSSGEWRICAPRCEPAMPGRIYVHPDSPSSGLHWMQETVSFGKLKITNDKLTPNNQIVLDSMHKYVARLHAARISSDGEFAEIVSSHVFEETSFMAVTAYQNQEMTHLKIANNPFAKGFREGSTRPKQSRESPTNGREDVDADSAASPRSSTPSEDADIDVSAA